MNFDLVPIHKRFDERGYFILDNNYLMSYSHHDGFTERLLSIDLLIDKNLELNIFHSCFKLGSQYKKTKDDFHFKLTVEAIPSEVLSFLDRILSNEITALKDNYDFEGISMDDNPSQLYLFNNDKQTKSVSINGLLPLIDDIFSTNIEQEFLKFHLFIKTWTNKVFDNYVDSASM